MEWKYYGESYRTEDVAWRDINNNQIKEIPGVVVDYGTVDPFVRALVYHVKWKKCFWLLTLRPRKGNKQSALVTDVYSGMSTYVNAKDLQIALRKKEEPK